MYHLTFAGVNQMSGKNVGSHRRQSKQSPLALQRLRAQAALYAAAPLDVMGEFFCEMAVDAGPKLTPSETLMLGEEWIATALGHIAVRRRVGQLTDAYAVEHDHDGAMEWEQQMRSDSVTVAGSSPAP